MYGPKLTFSLRVWSQIQPEPLSEPPPVGQRQNRNRLHELRVNIEGPVSRHCRSTFASYRRSNLSVSFGGNWLASSGLDAVRCFAPFRSLNGRFNVGAQLEREARPHRNAETYRRRSGLVRHASHGMFLPGNAAALKGQLAASQLTTAAWRRSSIPDANSLSRAQR